MLFVFFFYGLSFFLLGASISLQSRKGSEFKFGSYLWLLAIFGMLHGANEWLDMFRMLGQSYWTQRGMEALEIVRFFMGTVSFVFLFLFGFCCLFHKRGNWRLLLPTCAGGLGLLVGALFIYGIFCDFSEHWFFYSDLLMRYGLGFPSALLTAVAFLQQKETDEIKNLNVPSINYWLIGSAAIFTLFAVLDGLIVEGGSFFPASIFNYEDFMKTAGVPVQIFRTICAGGMLFLILRILNIFEMEKKFKLENAYREIIKVSTREQERIGQGIHDGLCQELTGILLNVKIIEKRLEALGLPEALQARKTAGLIDSTISHSRTLSKCLYPVEIEEHGLTDALCDFAETVEEIYGVKCTVRTDEDSIVKDHIVANHLFRISQEAVTNAVKHGKADAITISLGRGPGDKMSLCIVDNGSGISLPPAPGGGMGIKIMKYRAKVIDGTLEISSLQKGGAQVLCTFTPGEKSGGKIQQKHA